MMDDFGNTFFSNRMRFVSMACYGGYTPILGGYPYYTVRQEV